MSNKEIIEFQNIRFYIHPNYKKYFASKDGQILSLKLKEKKKLKLLTKSVTGYKFFSLCESNTIKSYSVSRFVYECFKGNIPDDKEVDHIDNNKENNSIKNLQLLTHKENTRKSQCKKVKSLNIETREEKKFKSIKEAAKYNCISPSSVSLNCKKITKITKSKKDGMLYVFNYI